VFFCLRPRTPYPAPLTHKYTFSHRERERGEGVLNQREGERGNRGEDRSQSWVENSNMIECKLKFLINTCSKVPFQINFFR
jgi:hypothetical protein